VFGLLFWFGWLLGGGGRGGVLLFSWSWYLLKMI
jgi:hypothetical protein